MLMSMSTKLLSALLLLVTLLFSAAAVVGKSSSSSPGRHYASLLSLRGGAQQRRESGTIRDIRIASGGRSKHKRAIMPSSAVTKPKVTANTPLKVARKDRLSNNQPKQVSTSRSTNNATSSHGATITNEVMNLVKAIVGVGVLSLPAGIAAFGSTQKAVIPALCLIATIGLLSGYGFSLIGKTCAYTSTTTYRDAWSASVGKRTSWIPAWTTTLKTCLACLAFSMVLGDTFTALLSSYVSSDKRSYVLSTITLFILLPLCWMKNLSSLAPYSLLGVLGMLYTGTFIQYLLLMRLHARLLILCVVSKLVFCL